MKNLFGILLFLLTALNAAAQSPVKVSGVLNRKNMVPVKLFKVVEGRTVEIANVAPEEDGKFGFLFYPQYEGLYVIGTGNEISAAGNYKFYFKAGDHLSLAINDKGYELGTGTDKINTAENAILEQWHKLSDPVYQKSVNFMRTNSTFVDFFPDLETIAAQSKTFLKDKKSGNVKFDKQLADIVKIDLAMYATTFLNTPRSAHPALEEFSPYYNTLRAQDFAQNTAKLYGYPWGFRTLTSIIRVNIRQQKKAYKTGNDGVGLFTSYVPNDTLKGDVVLENASHFKSYAEYQELMADYGKYVVTKSQKKQSEAILLPLLTYKPGTDAFNFSYPDKDGKIVTMASLKGKVVLVDVWATWCGPCKVEIPHLKKLEEEMKGIDVQVVSISVDEAKDKEKWQKMIKDENLGGLQLFASGWGDIAKYYKITGIPRFMVFDRNGKVVTISSPRPSSPELKKLLEKTLAAKN